MLTFIVLPIWLLLATYTYGLVIAQFQWTHVWQAYSKRSLDVLFALTCAAITPLGTVMAVCMGAPAWKPRFIFPTREECISDYKERFPSIADRAEQSVDGREW